MRLSVKAKLAGAFGVVIILTGVVGAVGYLKLSALNTTIDELVSRRVQLQRLAEELSIHTLKGIRAEKSFIIASDEVEMGKLGKDILAERATTHDLIQKVNALADASTLDVMKTIEETRIKYETVQDKSVSFALLNSNNRAHVAAIKMMPLKDKAIESLKSLIKANTDVAIGEALTSTTMAFYELWSDTQLSVSSPTMSELADFNKQIDSDRTDLKQAILNARNLLWRVVRPD